MDPNSYKNYSMFTDQVNENNGHYSYPSYTTSEASTYQTQNVESSCYYGNQQPSYGMENNHQQVDPASYCNQQTVNSNYYGNSQRSMHSQNGDQQMLNYSGVPTSERQQSAPDNSNPNNCSLQPPPSSVPWTQQSTSESVQPSDPLKQSRASHTGTSKVTKRKKAPRKKDVSKPQKPVSAYAHFFREKQTEIKTRNPDASFGEVSKIVAQEWESLPNQMKVVYKRKADQEKQEYLRAVATFKANIVAGNVAESTLPSAEGSADKTKLIAGVEQVAASQPPSTNMDQQAGHPQSIPTSSAPDESWMSEIDANLVWSPLSSEAINNSNTAQHQPNQTQLNYSNNNNPGGWTNEYYNNGDGSINPCKDVFDDWLDARQSSVTNH